MRGTQLIAAHQLQKDDVLEIGLSSRVDVGPAHLSCADQWE